MVELDGALRRPRTEVAKLKEQGDEDILVNGSAQLVDALARHDLVEVDLRKTGEVVILTLRRTEKG